MLVGIRIHNGIFSDNNVVVDINCLFWYLFVIKLAIIKKSLHGIVK